MPVSNYRHNKQFRWRQEYVDKGIFKHTSPKGVVKYSARINYKSVNMTSGMVLTEEQARAALIQLIASKEARLAMRLAKREARNYKPKRKPIPVKVAKSDEEPFEGRCPVTPELAHLFRPSTLRKVAAYLEKHGSYTR